MNDEAIRNIEYINDRFKLQFQEINKKFSNISNNESNICNNDIKEPWHKKILNFFKSLRKSNDIEKDVDKGCSAH